MKKSFQFRIYPTKNQEAALNRTLSTCRHLYNDSLEERKRQAELNELERTFGVTAWGKPEWLNYYDQANSLSGSKTEFQKEVFSQVLQNVLKRVDRSFKNFFNGFGFKDGKLNLSKIGAIKIILHREIEGKIKTCTIKKDIDQWYVTFSCDLNIPVIPVKIKAKTGIDVGLSSLITMSNGTQIEPPEFLRASEKRLSREQIHLSKKKLRSKNRDNQRIIVAKVHRRIRNQRKDFNQKLSTNLVKKYDHIVFEDLQVQNMVQNHYLAKSIFDAGWSQLMNLTKSKAEYAGKIVEFVNPRNTSQNCSGCGKSVPKDLRVRVHSCPFCGLVLDRDHNAAINIENRSTVGTTGFQACLSNLNREAMKQEAPQL